MTDDRRRAPAGAGKCCRSRVSARSSSSAVAWKLIALVFLQVVFVTMVYGPIAAYLVEAFPAQDSLHRAVAAVPHRQRRVRRTAAAHRALDRGPDGEHLRWSVLSDCRGGDHVHRRLTTAERDASGADLAGGGVKDPGGHLSLATSASTICGRTTARLRSTAIWSLKSSFVVLFRVSSSTAAEMSEM